MLLDLTHRKLFLLTLMSAFDLVQPQMNQGDKRAEEIKC